MANEPEGEVDEEGGAPDNSKQPILLLVVPENEVLVVGGDGGNPGQWGEDGVGGLGSASLQAVEGQVGDMFHVGPGHDRVVHRYVADHHLRVKSGSDCDVIGELPTRYVVDLVPAAAVGLQHPRREDEGH